MYSCTGAKINLEHCLADILEQLLLEQYLDISNIVHTEKYPRSALPALSAVMGYVHLDLPTSTQYVTFPTEQNQPVLIAWSEGRVPQTATYYVTKCYWGNFSPVPEPEFAASRHPQPDVIVDRSRKLNVLGRYFHFTSADVRIPCHTDRLGQERRGSTLQRS